MSSRCRFMLVVSACCLAGSTASAQVQDESRLSWAVTGQVFDVARVDNTLYVAGPATLGVALVPADEPFGVVDATTGTPTPSAFEISTPRGGSVNAAISDGAGGWYVGGGFTRIYKGGDGFSGLAHLTPPGVDLAFKPAVNGIVNGLWKEGSTLYVVGLFTQVNGQPRGNGAAFDLTTGALLPWDPALSGPGYVLAVSGGTVFLGGPFATASGTARPGFAAVDATTGALAASPTTTLNSGAIVNAMQLSGNTLYLGGLFTAIGGTNRTNVGAIDITSGATLPFQADTNGQVGALLPDGAALYMGGVFQTVGGQSRRRLARVDAATGAVDNWSADANGAVVALLRIGTTLYAGGGFSSIAGAPRMGVAALSTSTGTPLPWNPGLAGGNTTVLRAWSAGDVLAAGAFTHIGAVPRPGIAAIDIVTNELLPFSIAIDGAVRGITPVGNTLYLAGVFQTVNGEPRSNFAAVDRRTGALLPWNPNASGGIGNNLGGRSVAVQGSTAYIGGHFTSVGGQPRFGFARVDAATGAVLPFFTADTGGGGVNRIVLAGQTMYVGGNFSMIGGQVRQALAAFDLTSGTPALTALSVTLTSSVTPVINTMKVVGSTLYLGGIFSSVNGQARAQAAAITLPGGAVTPFAPGINGQVFDIDVLGPSAYLAGAFSQVNGAFRPAFAAVDAATGRVNGPFEPDNQTGVGSRVMAYPEGLLAAGNITGDWLKFHPTTGLAGLPGRPTAPIAGQIPGLGLFIFWGWPAVGGDVTGYRLEIGSAPGGANIATIPIEDSEPFFFYDGLVPPGTYYTRVRAVNAAGVGPPSEESAFTSGAGFCLGPFASPIPTAIVSGGNVTIAWPDPVLSAPMTYALSAGTTSGQANIGTFAMGSAMQFSAGAPPGAYFVRVHGQNACAIPPPSPELLVSVGGVFPLDAPAVTAVVSDGVVTVSWTAVAGATGYVLEAGAGPLDARIARVPVAGTSLNATAPPGTYYVRVYAVGGPTGASHASNETVIVVP